MAGQQPGQGGFGQGFGQTFHQPFGQQPAASPAPFSFGAAPSPAPAPGGTPPPGFGFGQSPAQAALQQQQQQPAAFGFGQPQAPAFGQQAAPSPAFGGAPAFSSSSTAGSAGFNFNSAAPAFTPAAAPPPRSFDFGSALRKQDATPSAAPIAFGSQAPGRQQRQKQDAKGEDDEEEEFDYEAAKIAALAAMPSFQGTGGGGFARPPPPPPPRTRKNQSSQMAAPAQQGEDPIEVARRMQRANRFAPVSAAPSSTFSAQGKASPQMFTALPVSSSPPPGFTRPSSFNIGGDGGSNNNDEDDDGGVGGGRGPIVGTCEDMCPASERERRQNMSDIQIFERVNPNNPNLTSADLAVRRFARTVDDPHPSEFRTRNALTRTMDYLRRLLDRTDVRFGLVHKFLWDRYRSIRQDLYIQNISDEFAINIFEEIVRFHVLCEHELCGEDQSVTDMEGFNSHLNMEQMNKALISLNEMYNKAAAEGHPSPNEAEFRTYHLLSLMAQHGKFKGDQQAFLSTLQALRPEVRGSAMVQWALKLRAHFVAGNFVRFFLLVQEATYLPACAAHTYFPAVRARFLRTLAETLAPTAARPAIVEIGWLRKALMMDSNEEVIAVAATHGFVERATDAETGEPALLLGKGQYVDPPPPLVKRSAEWIRAKAPGLRSVCVTTPARKPLSPEETAALQEQQRKAEQVRQEAAAAAQAEELRRQQAAAAAAEERQQQQRAVYEAQQRKFEEEQRAQQLEAEAQQRAEEEMQKQKQIAAAAEVRRLAEEAAERERKAAAERAAIEAAQRAAAEAEARRLEAERNRREAEEAERRRREEEERRRAEELRQRAAALRVRVFERKYFSRWVAQMRRLVAERRRKERIAASLKACRVGVVPGIAEEVAAAGAALGDLDIEGDGDSFLGKTERKSSSPFTDEKTSGSRGAQDLASSIAPFLAQNNPGVRSLFWKAAVLGSSSGGGSRSTGATATSSSSSSDSLLRWLQLQLSCGKLSSASSGSTYVDGPVEIELRHGHDALGTAVLKTCTAMPPAISFSSTSSTSSSNNSRSLYKSALAGASGVIFAASGDETAAALFARNLVAALPAAAPAVPVLLVAAGEEQAQLWLHTWLETLGSTLYNAKVHAISVSTSENSLIYSKTQLAQGLRWLAASAPPQPVLAVVRLEDATRDALAATTTSTIGNYSLSSSSTSLKTAVDLVTAAVKEAGASPEAAWQWPPPELTEGGLRHWYTAKTQNTLLSALGDIGAAAAATVDANAIAMHSKVSTLSAVQQPLVLPATAHANFCTALRTATEQQKGKEQNAQQEQDLLLQLRSSSPSRQQKRKWRHSPDGEAERPSGAAAHARLRQNLIYLEQNIALERSIERQFDAELAEAAGDLGVIKSYGGGIEDEQQEDDDDNVAVVFPTVQSRALQELNAALQQERKASISLWRRMKTMATSLF